MSLPMSVLEKYSLLDKNVFYQYNFFLSIKIKYIIKHKKTNKRTQSTKVPKHTQELYIEEPKRLEDKTKDKTAIRRTGGSKKRTKQKNST